MIREESAKREPGEVVILTGRQQISVRIILHNSEFLLPGHVVSGSAWEGFKPDKLQTVGAPSLSAQSLESGPGSAYEINHGTGWPMSSLAESRAWAEQFPLLIHL